MRKKHFDSIKFHEKSLLRHYKKSIFTFTKNCWRKLFTSDEVFPTTYKIILNLRSDLEYMEKYRNRCKFLYLVSCLHNHSYGHPHHLYNHRGNHISYSYLFANREQTIKIIATHKHTYIIKRSEGNEKFLENNHLYFKLTFRNICCCNYVVHSSWHSTKIEWMFKTILLFLPMKNG